MHGSRIPLHFILCETNKKQNCFSNGKGATWKNCKYQSERQESQLFCTTNVYKVLSIVTLLHEEQSLDLLRWARWSWRIRRRQSPCRGSYRRCCRTAAQDCRMWSHRSTRHPVDPWRIRNQSIWNRKINDQSTNNTKSFSDMNMERLQRFLMCCGKTLAFLCHENVSSDKEMELCSLSCDFAFPVGFVNWGKCYRPFLQLKRWWLYVERKRHFRQYLRVTFVVYHNEGLITSGEGDGVFAIVPPVEHRGTKGDIVKADHVVHLPPPVFADEPRIHETFHVPGVAIWIRRRAHPIVYVPATLSAEIIGWVLGRFCFLSVFFFTNQQKGKITWRFVQKHVIQMPPQLWTPETASPCITMANTTSPGVSCFSIWDGTILRMRCWEEMKKQEVVRGNNSCRFSRSDAFWRKREQDAIGGKCYNKHQFVGHAQFHKSWKEEQIQKEASASCLKQPQVKVKDTKKKIPKHWPGYPWAKSKSS